MAEGLFLFGNYSFRIYFRVVLSDKKLITDMFLISIRLHICFLFCLFCHAYNKAV